MIPTWRQTVVAVAAAIAAAISLGVIPSPWSDIVTVFIAALAGGTVITPKKLGDTEMTEGTESDAD
jgi:hypothetical protein